MKTKYKIGHNVVFGPFNAKITYIKFTPGSVVYGISYFDPESKYIISEVYEFEIEGVETLEFGFKKEKE